MREYKVTVNGERITVHLTEKQMWKLVNGRFNPHSNRWETRGQHKHILNFCPLCVQYHHTCQLCPLGKVGDSQFPCMEALYTISPWATRIIRSSRFLLNKDGSIPKRTDAAFTKVRRVLLAGKRVARRPKEA